MPNLFHVSAINSFASRPFANMLFAGVLCIGFSACAERTSPTSMPEDAPSASATPVVSSAEGASSAHTAAPTPAPASNDTTDAAIPADVVVSTNEPFWEARAEGGQVTLSGVDYPQRQWPITRSQMQGDTRVIVAQSEQGEVQLRIRAGKCEDSMSAAEFPYSGELRLSWADQGTITGCARPASMPPPEPPEEDAPADKPTKVETAAAAAAKPTIPEQFRGHWAMDQATCRNPNTTNVFMHISAREVRYYETNGVVSAIHQFDDDTINLTMDYEGEGETWTKIEGLKLEPGNRMTRTDEDSHSTTYVRCSASN